MDNFESRLNAIFENAIPNIYVWKESPGRLELTDKQRLEILQLKTNIEIELNKVSKEFPEVAESVTAYTKLYFKNVGQYVEMKENRDVQIVLKAQNDVIGMLHQIGRIVPQLTPGINLLRGYLKNNVFHMVQSLSRLRRR